jgi:hypothetical protein
VIRLAVVLVCSVSIPLLAALPGIHDSETARPQDVAKAAPAPPGSKVPIQKRVVDEYEDRLLKLIDRIDIEDKDDRLPADIRKLADEIAEAQAAREYGAKPAKTDAEVFKLPETEKDLEEKARQIAADLTTWDRLLTALHQPAEDAERYVHPDSAARDSTRHLRDRLKTMAAGINEKPVFASTKPEVDRYTKPKEANPAPDTAGPDVGDAPRVNEYVQKIDGTPADSVPNSTRLRTLHLRLELLNERLGRMPGPEEKGAARKAAPDSPKEKTRAELRKAIDELRRLKGSPGNESRELQAQWTRNLEAARKNVTKPSQAWKVEIDREIEAALKSAGLEPEKYNRKGSAEGGAR